jgi:2,6-dihydroxypseudooxynicotine hydrolase
MPDPKVQAAVTNWAPRFIAMGIDYNDYVRTTGRIERWDDWCREWRVTGDLHADLAAKAEAKGNRTSAGEAYVAAALCYHFGKFLFQDHPEEYMAAATRSIEMYTKGTKLLDPTAEKLQIPFEGVNLFGILRRPSEVSRPPLALLLPGLDSVKEEFFRWEEFFLKRGMATFSFDGPGQGESGFHTHIRPDYENAVSAALDALDKRSDIDSNRIGAVGVSMGSYYAVRALAYEPRVKAAVGNCGPYDMGECFDGLPELSRGSFLYHSGARDLTEARAMAHHLTLERVAPSIKRPLLIIHGKLDRIIPLEQAHKIANAVGPSAELVVYESGNHVCNNIPYLYRPLTADWLREKLG